MKITTLLFVTALSSTALAVACTAITESTPDAGTGGSPCSGVDAGPYIEQVEAGAVEAGRAPHPPSDHRTP